MVLQVRSRFVLFCIYTEFTPNWVFAKVCNEKPASLINPIATECRANCDASLVTYHRRRHDTLLRRSPGRHVLEMHLPSLPPPISPPPILSSSEFALVSIPTVLGVLHLAVAAV